MLFTRYSHCTPSISRAFLSRAISLRPMSLPSRFPAFENLRTPYTEYSDSESRVAVAQSQ